MQLSIELFLLDNLMMNYLMLRLGCVFYGGGVRQWRITLAAALGAVYALLSLTKLPVLRAVLPKLLLCLAMALPLTERARTYPKAFLCLLLSACLMGGVMFSLLQLFGGEFYHGAYVCTVSVRMALLAACVCACLPRLVVSVLHAVRQRRSSVRVCIRFADRTIELVALIDSGNLLTEPLSGLPVVVVRPGLLPETQHARPVAFRTVNGAGILYAIRPAAFFVYQGYWRRVDAMVAESAYALKCADAILPTALLTEEGRCMHAKVEPDDEETIPATAAQAGENAPVYPLGGDASGAVSPCGGAGMDRQAHA